MARYYNDCSDSESVSDLYSHLTISKERTDCFDQIKQSRPLSPLLSITFDNIKNKNGPKPTPRQFKILSAEDCSIEELPKLLEGHPIFKTPRSKTPLIYEGYTYNPYIPRVPLSDFKAPAILPTKSNKGTASPTTSVTSWMSDDPTDPTSRERPLLLSEEFEQFCEVCSEFHPKENCLISIFKNKDRRRITPPHT